jgi:UDP-N-acetyl-D-mannosaminuronic acid dehydrogenase
MKNPEAWKVEKIAVIGPGIVGMPMAAMLANARICQGTEKPARVVIVQRDSPTSGWKVDAVNAGRSVIGGIEPDLDRITRETVKEGLLSATHDYAVLSDADVVLVCVQTDKKDLGPDYGPMFGALNGLGEALQKKPDNKMPLIIFESTLAPSTMSTVFKPLFEKYGLIEGRDILLGNSPNRVMPGRLVERVAKSDKLIGGLSPQTPELINRLYAKIVTQGTLYLTNSMTAEIVKTLENAYRDVRVAFASEVVRYCDAHDIDFYQVRDQVNTRLAQEDIASKDPNAVPSGGVLVPTVGVGGHCLPKDGILMSWRRFEKDGGTDDSIIMESRYINDESPAETVRFAEQSLGSLDGKSVALLGVAYRFNSEDTRNSPTLPLAQLLLSKGCRVKMHDPYVKPTDQKLKLFNLQDHFTNDLEAALADAEHIIFCTGHKKYADHLKDILTLAPKLKAVIDGCNLYKQKDFEKENMPAYVGLGRGKNQPAQDFLDFVYDSFRVLETGMANELQFLNDFLNNQYADTEFNRILFGDVQRIAATCTTGCEIADPGPVDSLPSYKGHSLRLAACAHRAYRNGNG